MNHSHQRPRRSFAVTSEVAVVVDFRKAAVYVCSHKHGSVPLLGEGANEPSERMLFAAVAWPPRRLTRALARIEAARAWCERVGATRRREMEHVFAAQAEHARRVAALVAEAVLRGELPVSAGACAALAAPAPAGKSAWGPSRSTRTAHGPLLLTAAGQITRGDLVAFDDQGNVVRAADPATAVGYADHDADAGRNIEVVIKPLSS